MNGVQELHIYHKKHQGCIDDCNHGVVKKGRNVIQHPLDAHLPGDWLNFIIDLENNILTFYRNGIYQTKVEGQIPDGALFMLCHPDTAQDKFYIEEDTNSLLDKSVSCLI